MHRVVITNGVGTSAKPAARQTASKSAPSIRKRKSATGSIIRFQTIQ